MDTTAVADHSARKVGRVSDIAKVSDGGIEALIPELPSRWLLPIENAATHGHAGTACRRCRAPITDV